MYTDPDGHAEVALREYAEKLGGKVTWDNKSKTAIVQLNGATKQFKADNYKLVNGRMKLDDEIFNKTFGLNTKKSTSKVENKPTAASVAKNAGLGAGDAGVSAVTGIAHAVRHPIETGKGILTLAQYNPRVPNYTTIQINAAIADAATEAYDEFKEGDADVKARYIGRAVGEGILVAAGTKGVDKASKAARIGDIAADTAKIAKGTISTVPQVQTTRVGRWMSQAEYDTMVKTGKVPESFTGTTHVASPADINAFGKQAKPGSIYVEFDVPSSLLKPTNEGWSKIVGPNSLEGRLATKKGQPIPEMPSATNIEIKGSK